MVVMLRHAARLRPSIVSATEGLAVAATTSFVLALVLQFDATIMILIWNLGTAALIAVVATLFGRLGFPCATGSEEPLHRLGVHPIRHGLRPEQINVARLV